jgi:Family of unknown function (DUF6526)
MAEKTPQTYANHTKWDPRFHFFLIPVVIVTLGFAVWNLIKAPGVVSAWLVVVVIGWGMTAFLTRIYALKAQDRVIRLEERLRLAEVLPEPLRSRIGELTAGQLVALRFAPDSELAGLVQKALAGESSAEIKKAIVNWRPDYHRI